jgi:hypothetical protein
MKGYFPASPAQPRTAFGIDLLKFYLRMTLVSKAPALALSEALKGNLEDAGFTFNQKRVFLEQLYNVIPWFDALLRHIELCIAKLIDAQEVEVRCAQLANYLSNSGLITTSQQSLPGVIATPYPGGFDLHESTIANEYLRNRCPACFGRRHWGGDPDR